MSQLPSPKAKRVVNALPGIGWQLKNANPDHIEPWRVKVGQTMASPSTTARNWDGHKDLELKFEAFPLEAAVIAGPTANESLGVRLPGPIQVTLLQTDLWLDPTVPVESAVGSDSVVVGNSAPGQSPISATAVCSYVGAVELEAANGELLTLATGSFPLTLHVGGFYEDPYFERTQYSPFDSEA